ncbi:hypothetical protein [Rhizobium sp. P28RR-XV]|uniref:hypothetical protein n=1 Tax=Rhizobium sp. P28RR-XV TaxID=2726737 RepID=UPI001456E406|nr:hypothetical protein [Rhizobium sp. P28RR-XV]NLR88182.1 hypothetical protein [Rhizobium sp. P28RR-XV]
MSKALAIGYAISLDLIAPLQRCRARSWPPDGGKRMCFRPDFAATVKAASGQYEREKNGFDVAVRKTHSCTAIRALALVASFGTFGPSMRLPQRLVF